MSTRRALTGGTGDVNPQFVTGRATQSAADTTTTIDFPVPIQRLQQQGRAQVLEVLKVFWFPPVLPVTGAAAETIDSIAAFLTTSSFGTTTLTYNNPRIISGFDERQKGAFTAGGTYSQAQFPVPFIQDLTDGAGHGVLIATDSIFVQVSSVGTGASNSVDFKLLYRWKNVSLAEYIGIVQSQQ